MAYQTGKVSTVLNGKIDNIILTGGIAHSKHITKRIINMIKFIADIIIYPGEDEMEALNLGVLRVLKGIEKQKNI